MAYSRTQNRITYAWRSNPELKKLNSKRVRLTDLHRGPPKRIWPAIPKCLFFLINIDRACRRPDCRYKKCQLWEKWIKGYVADAIQPKQFGLRMLVGRKITFTAKFSIRMDVTDNPSVGHTVGMTKHDIAEADQAPQYQQEAGSLSSFYNVSAHNSIYATMLQI